ncbi:segregation/condensation protein A [[Limnothrix rosea] IAM M-220]|uniref:segregation/condensation protein A n=1 Tax=[Limnothrix rosea] IAM M-220 TaxID=454133 RepID=UPI00096734AB|nr:segregation/condensation protein A [[Limnothrix rosea] IAM M-220]OKH18735.1 segregation and condensation protein A [[Limnothrix rosea] IAM M-220]
MANKAQEAIATLINLAQEGEIDPWDVQVIDVIDQFLSELGLTGRAEDVAVADLDLPQSGQTFLWASKLVLLKADTLESLTAIEEELQEDDFLEEWDEANGRRLPLKLEKHIRRRASAPPPKRRRVTLQEFIIQIQQIANEIEDHVPKQRVKRPRKMSNKAAIKQITQLAHDENLTELAAQLEQFFQTRSPDKPDTPIVIELNEVVTQWLAYKEANEFFPEEITRQQHRHEKVGIFWALLLLSAQSKVELLQDDFYAPILVRPLYPDLSEPTDKGAIASTIAP